MNQHQKLAIVTRFKQPDLGIQMPHHLTLLSTALTRCTSRIWLTNRGSCECQVPHTDTVTVSDLETLKRQSQRSTSAVSPSKCPFSFDVLRHYGKPDLWLPSYGLIKVDSAVTGSVDRQESQDRRRHRHKED
ncbi:hypothetical protein BDV18DRAFT_28732 [Aspergillus unguis]